MFEENDDNPDIEALLYYLKYEYEESNTDTCNVFGDQEVDIKVDINEPRVTRYGRLFGIKEFNINQIEDLWFDEINATYEEYKKYPQIL